MNLKKWYFAVDNTEKDSLSDKEVEIFRTKGDGPDAFKGIAREVIQNSIDAKQKNLQAPLIVKFNFIDIQKSEFPDVVGLRKHIKGTVDFCNEKNKKNIALSTSNKQLSILEQDQFCVLKISDYNTNGVTGSEDLNSGKSKWKGLVYNDGDNIKDSSNSLGSFGLGKNASFAISTLRTVFYVTKDINKNYAMEGVAKLYTSYVDGVKQVCEGYLCNENNGKTGPLTEEQATSISSIFRRDETGTDVIIFEPNIHLFKEKVKWYLIESIISNFFMAFIDNELEVFVENIEINGAKLNKVFGALKKFYEDNDIIISQRLISVGQYLETIEFGDDCSGELEGYGNIYLKLRKTQDTKFKKVAIFREHGMLIKEIDVNSASQKFSGVLVVKGKEGIKFLKSIEDPNHTDFDATRETEDLSLTQTQKQKKLNEFYDWIKSSVRLYTQVESSDNIALSGMEEYIQMPEKGDILAKKSKEITVNKIKRKKSKELQRIYERKNVDGADNGSDTPEIPHKPKDIIPVNPHYNDYDPKPMELIENKNSEQKGFLTTHVVSYTVYPIMKYYDNKAIIIFNTTAQNKKLNVKIVAVGEDGKDNNYFPKIKSAVDMGNNKNLKVQDCVIKDIDSNKMSKLAVEFERKIMTRLKLIVYWEEVKNEKNK